MKKLFNKKSNKKYKVESKSVQHSFPVSKQDEAVKSKDDYHKAIGKMSAFFAHEIRNPLTSIIGFTQVLEKDKAVVDNPTLQHYVSIIKDESSKIESLIQELLNLANSHTYFENISIINVKNSIDKIIDLFEYQFNARSITLNKETTADDIFVTGNERGLERSLINMVKNAAEAIEENGDILIRAFSENGIVTIDIIDSGPGIPEDALENIFYPFYTTKDDGTGIGLPISKTVIEMMNGNIEVSNHEKLGVHMQINLPESKHASYKS